MSIVVLYNPTQIPSTNTVNKLKALGIEHDAIDVSIDAEAWQVLRDLGYHHAPVVIVDDDHWCGHRPDKIDELAA